MRKPKEPFEERAAHFLHLFESAISSISKGMPPQIQDPKLLGMYRALCFLAAHHAVGCMLESELEPHEAQLVVGLEMCKIHDIAATLKADVAAAKAKMRSE